MLHDSEFTYYCLIKKTLQVISNPELFYLFIYLKNTFGNSQLLYWSSIPQIGSNS